MCIQTETVQRMNALTELTRVSIWWKIDCVACSLTLDTWPLIRNRVPRTLSFLYASCQRGRCGKIVSLDIAILVIVVCPEGELLPAIHERHRLYASYSLMNGFKRA